MRRVNQLHIATFFKATAGFAVYLTIERFLEVPGPPLALVYIAGPALAFSVSRLGTRPLIRYWIAIAMLAFMMSVAYSSVAIVYGMKSASIVLPVSIMLWGPQVLFSVLVRAAWKSGLRSAGIAPYSDTHGARG